MGARLHVLGHAPRQAARVAAVGHRGGEAGRPAPVLGRPHRLEPRHVGAVGGPRPVAAGAAEPAPLPPHLPAPSLPPPRHPPHPPPATGGGPRSTPAAAPVVIANAL